VFLNVLDGRIAMEAPSIPMAPLIPGGLLCEEMVCCPSYPSCFHHELRPVAT
jgi:hypothetical protein